jgi:hypothetical protein
VTALETWRLLPELDLMDAAIVLLGRFAFFPSMTPDADVNRRR